MIMAKVTQGFCFWHKWITERDAGITQYQRCSRCGARRIVCEPIYDVGDYGYPSIDYDYLLKGHEQPESLPERETGLTEGKIKSNTKPPAQWEKPRIHPAAHPHRLVPGEQHVVDSIRSEIPALMASDLARKLNALTETYGDGPVVMTMDVGDDVKASPAVGLLVLPDPSETVFLISDNWRP